MSVSLLGDYFHRFLAYLLSLALFFYFSLLVVSRAGELVYFVIAISFLMIFLLLYKKELLFAVLFFLLPLTFGLPLWFGSTYFSTVEIALLVTAILFLQVYPKRLSLSLKGGGSDGWIFNFLMLFFICSGFVSVLKGVNLLSGLQLGNIISFQDEIVHIFRPYITLLEFFLLFFLLNAFRPLQQSSTLLKGVTFGTFICLWFAIGQYYYQLPVLRSYEIRAFEEVQRVSASFTDANSFAGYLLLFFPLLCASFFYLKGWVRWVSLVTALLSLPVLYLTGCKAALCGIVVEFTLALFLLGGLLILERRRGGAVVRLTTFFRKYFSLFFLFVMLLLASVGYLTLQQQNLTERFAEDVKGKSLSYLYHLQSNGMALKLYHEKGDPLFGMAPGTYFSHAAKYSVQELKKRGREHATYDLLGPKPDLPHNFYLEILTEFGLFGFCSLFGVALFLWGRGLVEALYAFVLNRHEKEYWQSHAFLSFAALLSIAGYGCFILFQNHAIADMHLLLGFFFYLAIFPWFGENENEDEKEGEWADNFY